MRSRVGQLFVEITPPESPKFRHPLLLLHGLWTGSWIWERLTPYLAHRGWESWAPSLRDDARPRTAAETIEAIERVARALPAVPIVVSHDAGVIAAASLAGGLRVPALVVLAPVAAPDDVPTARALFRRPEFWLRRLWGAGIHPPWSEQAFAGEAVAACRGRFLPESGPFFRALAASRLRLPGHVGGAGLVVSGGADPVSPPPAGEAVAARFGWRHRVYAGRGHFLMLERGWEALADDVHRWVVQTVGTELLALLDDDEDG